MGAPLPAVPDRRVLQAAADWFARLGDERAGPDDTRLWQAWLAATPEHRRAWDAVSAISARFEAVAGQPALDALTHAGQGRRRALRTLMLLAGVGGVGAAAWDQPVTRRLRADLRTDVGETRQATLADGSRLWLNTASAIDLRFDDAARRVVLIDGETLIDTHPDPRSPARPFLLDVGYARLQALGTRFAVLRDDDRAWLDVYAGAVQIQPARAAPRVAQAGTRTAFSAHAIDEPEPLDRARDAWTRGELIADGTPLAHFAVELARYRRGFVTCSPQIAQLPLVGVFPLADTDRILRALEATLPVRARRVLPGWVRLEAA